MKDYFVIFEILGQLVLALYLEKNNYKPVFEKINPTPPPQPPPPPKSADCRVKVSE